MRERLDELAQALDRASTAVKDVMLKADRAGLGYSLGRLAAAEMLRRRKRDQLFGSDLFLDPAWDMLLDLYAAEEAERPVSLKSLSNGSGAPISVTLRYLTALQEAGHVTRNGDGTDGRRDAIRLTSEARLKMAAYLLEGRALASPPRDPRSDARVAPPQSS